LHVFMCKILANMTQVSDVAPGPLVYKYLPNTVTDSYMENVKFLGL
jgi:hypothetical protein